MCYCFPSVPTLDLWQCRLTGCLVCSEIVSQDPACCKQSCRCTWALPPTHSLVFNIKRDRHQFGRKMQGTKENIFIMHLFSRILQRNVKLFPASLWGGWALVFPSRLTNYSWPNIMSMGCISLPSSTKADWCSGLISSGAGPRLETKWNNLARVHRGVCRTGKDTIIMKSGEAPWQRERTEEASCSLSTIYGTLHVWRRGGWTDKNKLFRSAVSRDPDFFFFFYIFSPWFLSSISTSRSAISWPKPVTGQINGSSASAFFCPCCQLLITDYFNSVSHSLFASVLHAELICPFHLTLWDNVRKASFF